MNSHKLLTIFALALVAALALPSGAEALTVSPAKLELSGDPGAVVTGEIQIFNEQKDDKIFYSSSENFEAQGESGTPNFVPGTEGLATWIDVPGQITLKAGETKKLPVTVTIPHDADAGGHFAAIFWSSNPKKEKSETQISVDAKVGILVLLKVSGDIKTGGGILEFNTDHKQTFYNTLPVKFFYRFQNSGNDRVQPTGEIEIKNILGQTVDKLPANENQGNVLPTSIRKFEAVWTGKEKVADPGTFSVKSGFFDTAKKQWNNFACGRYTASLDLKYGDDKSLQKNFSFWIIPWQLLSLVLIVLIVFGVIVIKGIKRYNKMIVSKATKMNSSF